MMKKAKSYKDLEIFTLAKRLAVKTHKMTLEELPKIEDLFAEYEELGAKLFNFRESVIKGHLT